MDLRPVNGRRGRHFNVHVPWITRTVSRRIRRPKCNLFANRPCSLANHRTVVRRVHFYGYRYYSPELGRWASRDPLGEEGGLCEYAAAKNSMVGSFDTLGLLTLGEYYANVVTMEKYEWVVTKLAARSKLTLKEFHSDESMLARWGMRALLVDEDSMLDGGYGSLLISVALRGVEAAGGALTLTEQGQLQVGKDCPLVSKIGQFIAAAAMPKGGETAELGVTGDPSALLGELVSDQVRSQYAQQIRSWHEHRREYEAVIKTLLSLDKANQTWLNIMQNIKHGTDSRFLHITSSWGNYTEDLDEVGKVSPNQFLTLLTDKKSYWQKGVEALRREEQEEDNWMKKELRKNAKGLK